MEWTDISFTVPRPLAQTTTDILTAAFGGGLYIEDYADIEEQAMAIAHIDLIEQELLDKPRDIVTIHLYLSPEENAAAAIDTLRGKLLAADIQPTIATKGVLQEDWENAWKQYYHPIEIGTRLAVAPSWEEYDSNRVTLRLDPGMAFGTGTHETTYLCMEMLDQIVQGGESLLDIGTGSGILAVAALLLGAKSALGIDIDPMAVRTAGENAQRNGVEDRLVVKVGDLAKEAQGTFDIITANIVADAIIALSPAIPALLADNGHFIASGIIVEREDEVLVALQKALGAKIKLTVHHKNGWTAIHAHKA